MESGKGWWAAANSVSDVCASLLWSLIITAIIVSIAIVICVLIVVTSMNDLSLPLLIALAARLLSGPAEMVFTRTAYL